MKIMDRLGNELRPGCTYHFKPIDAPVTLKDVQEPGVIDKTIPGRVVLEVTIPFMPDGPDKHVMFPDLMQVVHPQESAKVQSIIDNVRKATGTGGGGKKVG